MRDTFFARIGRGRWAQDLKFGGAWQHVTDDWFFPAYPHDSMVYFSVDRSMPFVYTYAEGVGHSTVRTNLISGFVQTELRPSPRAAVSLGVRYDLDTAGNNPDYTSPLVPTPRGRDTNNLQPRAGFSWDLTGAGRHVVRGGIGYFTGRLLLVPAHIELQQNGYTGRIIRQRLNGQVLGLPPAFWLRVTDPRNTGIALPPAAAGFDDEIVNPHATQLTGGYTARLGNTGLYADVEAIFVKGDDELVIRDTNWPGNDDPACAVSATRCRPNSSFSQISLYANEGRSEYKALVVGVNGVLWGRHTVSASWTLADKKNISDDFSPALNAYPSDPARHRGRMGPLPRRRAAPGRGVCRPPGALRDSRWRRSSTTGRASPGTAFGATTTTATARAPIACPAWRSTTRTAPLTVPSICASPTGCRSGNTRAWISLPKRSTSSIGPTGTSIP